MSSAETCPNGFDSDEKLFGASGSVSVLWVIATAEEPLTSPQIAEITDADPSNVRGRLKSLTNGGYLRRHRIQNNKRGPNPYAYELTER